MEKTTTQLPAIHDSREGTLFIINYLTENPACPYVTENIVVLEQYSNALETGLYDAFSAYLESQYDSHYVSGNTSDITENVFNSTGVRWERFSSPVVIRKVKNLWIE